MREPTVHELAARFEERDRLCHERIDGLAKRVEQRFDAEEKALDHARREVDHRLEGMNEFRAQILAERGTFINRDVFDARVQQTDEKLLNHDRAIQTLQGRIGPMYFLAGAIIVAVIGQIVSVLW